MLHRYFKHGEKLDVAGLNQITVLIDRNESELTEIALNEWRSGLEGPPHMHAEKDQIFYITSGEGTVLLGTKIHEVQKGCLAYIPAGLVHRTTTTSVEPLRYILYNIFNSTHKEGHASFAEHIQQVKSIRKRQAETGSHEVTNAEKTVTPDKESIFFKDVFSGKTYDFGSNSTILLLDRTQTNRCEFVVVQWPEGSKGAMVAHKEKEQAFFILRGEGLVTIGDETETVRPGEIIFVPRNTPHTTEATQGELVYLCLNSLVTQTADPDFDSMYQRIAPQRINRWKSGDDSVGE
jgi:mannose-6-phosphate isomerase-like protein (cupin superfamily)